LGDWRVLVGVEEEETGKNVNIIFGAINRVIASERDRVEPRGKVKE